MVDAYWTVGALAASATPISPDTPCGSLLDAFQGDAAPVCLPVIQDGVPIGLISRHTLLLTFANPIHNALYDWRPVRGLMDADPMIVANDMDVDEAARIMALEKPRAVVDGFIVTRDGAADGVAAAMDLLRRTAERERERAGELERARAATEAALQNLHAAQTDLVESEKLASLGGLVAGVAHEINTPLGVTLTATSIAHDRARAFLAALDGGEPLKKSAVRAFVADQTENLDVALANIRRAVDLVGGFKQVAVDRTADARRSFALGAYLNEVIGSLRPMLRRAGAETEIVCGEDIDLDSYPGALSQIVTNLTENALKHAWPGGAAGRMILSVEPSDGETVALTFRDDGVGIPADHLKRIFDPFFTTKRGAGGSGLGLHIVYNLVRGRLGGTVSVTSEADAGAAFRIEIPRTAPAAATGDA